MSNRRTSAPTERRREEASMPPRASAEDLARQSRFVFHGTVQRLNDATMPEVPTSDRTAVVRVDDVIQAPGELVDYAGRDVTVLLSGRRKLAPGDQAIFFTNGWLYGDSLAVRSIGERPPPRTAATLS